MNHLLTFTGFLLLFLTHLTIIVTSNENGDFKKKNTTGRISNISFTTPAIYEDKFPMSFLPTHKITSRILSFDDEDDFGSNDAKFFTNQAKVTESQTGTGTMKNELERPKLTSRRNHGHVPTHIKNPSGTSPNNHRNQEHSSENFNREQSSHNDDGMVDRGSESDTLSKFITTKTKGRSNEGNGAKTTTKSLLMLNSDSKQNKDTLLVQDDDFNYKYELLSSRDKDESQHQHQQQMTHLCRQQSYLPSHLFRLHACAYCYFYAKDIPSTFGFPSRKWNLIQTKVRSDSNKAINYEVAQLVSRDNANLTIFANASDPNLPLLPSFETDHARENWVDCCHAAESCCGKMQYESSQQNETDKEETCPATWDGWQCWNKTSAGTQVHLPCPHYIYYISEVPACAALAEKTCLPGGNWYRLSGTFTVEWTNYTTCAGDVIEAQKLYSYIHISAYAVTIIATIPALIIFFSYKQLRVHRIILHQNLFFSMLLNGIFVIGFKMILLQQLNANENTVSIISQNGIGCRFLFILTKYFRMTNYMWMFCEGYYLHKLIASAFAEQKSLIIFYIIGWVFPIIPTIVYGSLRMAYANENCWVQPQEQFEWILNSPSLLSLLINMLFLINIIRVLVTKLRAAHANEPSQYRKAVRATLVLLPLFGCHFVVTIYRPKSSTSGACEWLEIYHYTNYILDGIQGFLVALIFCYLNGEVVFLLKRTYGRWNEQHGMSGGCPVRGGSSARNRLQSRSSRGGSFLGRSVVSTQCYSSVPPSPEICCNLVNRLSLSSSNHTTAGGGGETTKRPSCTPSPKLSPINGNGLPVVAKVVKNKNSERNNDSKSCGEEYELKSSTNHQNTSLQIINVEDIDCGSQMNNFPLSSKSKKNNEHQL